MGVSTEVLPYGLELVVDYVNTRDVEAGTDALSSPEVLAQWLADHGVLPLRSAADDSDLAAATDLREALRTVLLSHHENSPPPAATVAVLDQVAARGHLSVQFDPTTTGLVTLTPRAGGIAGALAAILTPAALAAPDGTWRRVKACAAEDCQWAFFDRSRNHSGRWCDMAICGNRTKVRSYRQRTQRT